MSAGFYDRTVKYSTDPATGELDRDKILAVIAKLEETLRKYEKNYSDEALDLRRLELKELNLQLDYDQQVKEYSVSLKKINAGNYQEEIKQYTATLNTLIKTRADLAEASAQVDGRIVSKINWELRGIGKMDPMRAWEAFVGTATEEGQRSGTDQSVPGTVDYVLRAVHSTSINYQAEDREAEINRILAKMPENDVQDAARPWLEKAFDVETKRLATVRSLNSLEDDTVAQIARMENGKYSDIDQYAKESYELLTRGVKEAVPGDIELRAATAHDDIVKMENFNSLGALRDDLVKRLDGPGGPSQTAKVAKIIMNDNYRYWAEAYGFRLGDAEFDEDGQLTRYTPGPDDMSSIAWSMYAKAHPDSVFVKKRMGQVVRVEYGGQDNPDDSKHSDGKWYYTEDAGGHRGYVSEDHLKRLHDQNTNPSVRIGRHGHTPGGEPGMVVAQSGDNYFMYSEEENVWVKLGGAVEFDEGGTRTGVVQDPDTDEFMRFLTLDDLTGAAPTVESFGAISDDQVAEYAAIGEEKLSSIKDTTEPVFDKAYMTVDRLVPRYNSEKGTLRFRDGSSAPQEFAPGTYNIVDSWDDPGRTRFSLHDQMGDARARRAIQKVPYEEGEERPRGNLNFRLKSSETPPLTDIEESEAPMTQAEKSAVLTQALSSGMPLDVDADPKESRLAMIRRRRAEKDAPNMSGLGNVQQPPQEVGTAPADYTPVTAEPGSPPPTPVESTMPPNLSPGVMGADAEQLSTHTPEQLAGMADGVPVPAEAAAPVAPETATMSMDMPTSEDTSSTGQPPDGSEQPTEELLEDLLTDDEAAPGATVDSAMTPTKVDRKKAKIRKALDSLTGKRLRMSGETRAPMPGPPPKPVVMTNSLPIQTKPALPQPVTARMAMPASVDTSSTTDASTVSGYTNKIGSNASQDELRRIKLEELRAARPSG